MALAIIALGANLGDRRANIEKAALMIRQRLTGTRLSSIYESPALTLDHSEKPPYLNAVLIGTCTFSAEDLLSELLAIETAMGRKRRTKWESREIDLDLLAFDQRIIETPALRIPHPHLHQRAFVLKPLVEIFPDWHHPVLNMNAKRLLTELSMHDPDQVRRCVPAQIR